MGFWKKGVEEKGPSSASGMVSQKKILPLAVAVGVVPCPGVMIVMLFGMSQDMIGIGLVLSLFMARGMGLTISFVGILSILGQKGMLKSFARHKKRRLYVEQGLSIFGALLIVLLGTALLLGMSCM